MWRLIRSTFPVLAMLMALTPTLSAQAAEPDALARISAQLEHAPVLRAEFTQTRQLAALKRPLISTGQLVFSRSHGVLWQIEKPYRMTYVLGPDKVVEISADGLRRERSVRDLPGLAQVSRIFSALLGADTAALRELFDLTLQSDPKQWRLALKPRQAHIAQSLSGITLSGSRFVDSIRLDEASGDSTHIRLQHSHSASTTSAAELALFQGPLGPAQR